MSAIFRCDGCQSIYAESDLLTAANPFDPEQMIASCPDCKNVGEFTNVCDEPGCEREAGCGWPADNGRYRWTCGAHWTRGAHMREGER